MFKRTLFLSVLLFITISCHSQNQEGVKVISVTEFESQLQPKMQLVDVRTEEEFSEGHIENALNYNVNNTDFKTQVTALDKTKPVYIYCKSGKRSAKAATQLKDMGFTTIYDLDGGFEGWLKEGKAMDK